MNTLKKKMGKKGGFTLVEMLIVVAIIAILVAISIPMINVILERARHGVDDANYRNAVSLGNVELLTQNPANVNGNYYYQVTEGTGEANDHQGELIKATTTNLSTIESVAECTCAENDANRNNSSGKYSFEDAFLQVKIDNTDPDNAVIVTWVAAASTT